MISTSCYLYSISTDINITGTSRGFVITYIISIAVTKFTVAAFSPAAHFASTQESACVIHTSYYLHNVSTDINIASTSRGFVITYIISIAIAQSA